MIGIPFCSPSQVCPVHAATSNLAHVVADEGSAARFARYAALDADVAPTNTAQEFLAFCGVLGYGRLLAEGDAHALDILRRAANDPRWRMREAAATALQRVGDADMDRLLTIAEQWVGGTLFERRVMAAALCEPRLLKQPEQVNRVLHVLDTITAELQAQTDRRSAELIALRKGLAYCWSVAVAALPAAGKPLMARWLDCTDPDIRWIMRENLKKQRLIRMDAAWVAAAKARLTP